MKAPCPSLAVGLLLVGTAATVAAAQQPAAAAPARRAFQLSDWYRVVQLSTPALSPDGDAVAFTVTTAREARNDRHQEIWLVPVDGGAPRRLTSPGYESSNPRWSDDGSVLSFTSRRPGGRGTTWQLRMDQPGEAMLAPRGERPREGQSPADGSFTITSDPAGGGFGAFGGRGRPDDDSLSTDSTATSPYAKMEPMARPPYGAITKPAVPERFDGRHIVQERYKSNNAGFIPGPQTAPREEERKPAQLYIQRGDGERTPLTSTAYSHRGFALSPDGKWVAFIADARLRPDSVVEAERDSVADLPPSRERDEALRNDTEVYVLPVAACEARTAECTPRKIDYPGNESDIVWSPDSKQLAFVGRLGRFENARLFVAPAEGGRAQDVLGSWKYEPDQIRWLRNGRISMVAMTGGATGVYELDPRTKQVTTILGGRRVVSGVQYDSSESHITFISTDLTHPTELFVADADGKNERKLTSFNDKLNAEVAWSDAERFTYKSVDGLEIEGWLMKPYGYQPGKKYPLVLYIHGGPHSRYSEGWFDEFQNLAAEGMWVLFTNPRGSSGTNADFTYASRGDWGGKDYQDLMKAVDIAAARPDVDSTRMGVTGGSYGGFMTAWVTTKTDRFKAAQTDRMISDWTYWWGASDVQGLTNGEFFGRPWENQKMYDELSPIRHVKSVKTPTLIVQSEEDYRTPMGNAELWFMALKNLDVPVEMVRYPRSTHELSRSGEPWLLVDRLGRLRQWFGYWLSEARPKTTTAEAGGSR
ncbi:MAG TPA: S9 family peptidase [Gemmatimonadaceae bacterium]|nr:S9 family peptidase [Gemmatimonadaceae bacterium]